MVFHNLWGLLGLLSIPAILGLHYFRSRRRRQRIGGLYLWEFARVRLPAGRRWDRIVRNLSLYSQLAAALIATLLIAGMDAPMQGSVRHFTVVLDDSVSMQAGAGESAADRARKFLLEWIDSRDRYTVIAAGASPKIIAGPFAERGEVERALAQWRPEEVVCDLEAATNLAGKFISGDEKILFLSDHADANETKSGAFEIAATGEPLANSAIVFADRMRMAPGRDKALIALQRFSADAGSMELTGTAKGQTIFRQSIDAKTTAPINLAFETDAVDAPLVIRIGDDPLSADNVATLEPVPIKPVKAAMAGLAGAEAYFLRALQAVPYVQIVDPADKPDLLFTSAPVPANASAATTASAAVSQGPWRTYYLPLAEQVKTSAALAQGADILTDPRSAITEGLTFEGVLWPLADERATLATIPLIAWRGVPLLYQLGDEPGRRRYRMNLLTDRTNLFRQATWPTFIQGAVEECRLTMPGMGQTNFRQGEPIPLQLEADPAAPREFSLTRNGRPWAAWDALPPELNDLPIGEYEVRQGERKLAGFAVNLCAPGESDLRAAASHKPQMSELTPAELRRSQSNPLVYYLLLLALLTLTGMSWHYQDTSR